MSIVPAQFLRGTFWSSSAVVMTGILGYLTRRFMANNLPENDYAFFYSVFSLLSILAILLRCGLSDVILYEFPGLLAAGRRREAGVIYNFTRRVQRFLAFIGFLCLCAAIPFLKKYFFTFPVVTGNLLLFFIVIWGLVGEDTVLFALNSLKNFGTSSGLRLLKTGLFCIAVVIFLRWGSLSYVIASFVIITTVCTLIGEHLAVKHGGFCDEKNIPLQIRKRIIGGGVIFLALSGGRSLYRDFGALAVAFFSTTEEVVLFNIALPIAMIVLSFEPVIHVFTPMMADYFAKRKKTRLRRFIWGMLFLSAAIMTTALFVLFFWGEYIIQLLFSAKFAAAKFCTLYLVESAIIAMQVSVFHGLFNAAGQKMISVRTLLPAAVVALVVFPILSHTLGATGAGIATLVTVCVLLAACLVYYIKFMRNWKDI